MFYPASQQVDTPAFSDEERSARQQWPADSNTPCYVILFGVGEADVEGIYTLRTTDWQSDDMTSVDTVVAFESEVDAQRFATLLEASLSHKPCVFPISWADVTEWCNDSNTRCRLEPAGSLLIPPESNVEQTDWERALALQRGEFKVLDQEPQVHDSDPVYASASGNGGNSGNVFLDAPEWWLSVPASEEEGWIGDDVVQRVAKHLAEADLAAVRAGLERLMNQ